MPLPQDWTGESDLSDALIATAHRLPQAKFIITTLGKRGAVLLERGSAGAAAEVLGLWCWPLSA
jgi:sugar/nucleoside kinase (ribokinase family)